CKGNKKHVRQAMLQEEVVTNSGKRRAKRARQSRD
ncbi:hypothetical protein V3C99_010149, partial [Haemonchus contortus]